MRAALPVALAFSWVVVGCGTEGAAVVKPLVVPPVACHHYPKGWTPPTLTPHTGYLDSMTPDQQETAVAEDPMLRPPSRHPHYVSRASVIRTARQAAASEYSPAAPATAKVTARLMTIVPFERLLGEGYGYTTNVHRKLWVVTVHARTVSSHGRRPTVYSVYTHVFDAETGRGFAGALGCDPFAGVGK